MSNIELTSPFEYRISNVEYRTNVSLLDISMFYLVCAAVETGLKLALSETQRIGRLETSHQGYKLFFILNSAEFKIYPAHKC